MRIAMVGHKRVPSREGGIEVVVEELAARMVMHGHSVTCYNRTGHHVSGKEYDIEHLDEYRGIRLKRVPTIDRKGLAAVTSSFFGCLAAAFGPYDVVHIHAEGPAMFSWLPRLTGKRVVLTVHGLDWARDKWKGSFGSWYIHTGEKTGVRFAHEIIVLNYTHDAIVAIDENGRISTTNQIAEQMLRPAQPPFAGQPIEEVLPNTHLTSVLQTGEAEIGQMMNIHGTLVSTNRVPIRVGGQVKGVVATFQDIKTLQTAERNIRIKLHEKGLVAKYRFSDILGQSPAILEAKHLSENFADSQFTVMLYGETGTGKEMFAQSIHNASPRRVGPFVAINCTALNRNLLESELFGYADSSFTGARRGGKAGLFETAHGGTIFLDEIGELPLEFQAPLLRVLQEKEVRRVGDDTVIPVDIRIIGATNRDLLHLVEEGRFRRDLYYRLNVLSVLVPPLRERGDDYLEIARAIYDRVMPQRSADEESAFFRVLGRCRSYAWPGNVRELTNTVERVSLLLHRGSPEEEVFQSLKMNLWRTAESAPAARERTTDPATDKSDVLEALRRSGGNASRAAKDLGISRSTLYRRLKQNP